MSSCSGNAAAMQTVAVTAVDAYLTAAATSTFFAYKSMAYSVFATDFAELQLTGATTLNNKTATQGSCVIDRRGDRCAGIFLQFKADAIMNISQDSITLHGAGAPVAANTGGDLGVAMKRGIVGGLGQPQWVPVKFASGVAAVTCSALDQDGAATITGVTGDIQAGDRVTVHPSTTDKPLTTFVKTTAVAGATALSLETGPLADYTATAYIFVEREINRGSVVRSNNPFIPEDHARLIAEHVVSDGPRRDISQSASGQRYRGVGGDPADLACYYRAFAPIHLVDSVTLLCGSQCLDTLTALALLIYHEVFVKAQTVRNMNATRDINLLKKWALQPSVWRMRMPFNMCTSYAKSLSLVSICLHNLKLNVKFNPVMNAVANGVGGIFTDAINITSIAGGAAATNPVFRTCAAQMADLVTPWTTASAATTATDPLLTASSALFTGANVACSVLVEYIYTGKAEREMEINLSDRMVVVEHQELANVVVSGTGAVSTQLTFTHPVSAVFCTAVSSAHTLHGDKFNPDGLPDPLTYDRLRPRDSLVPLLKSFYLKFNSSDRTPNTDPSFYREMQSSHIIGNVPGTEILAYYFGVGSPYEAQQSGSANMARMERVEAIVQMNSCYAKDNSSVGGLNAIATTAGVGAMSAAHQLNVTYSALSINVWEVSDCMMGRVYA